MSVKAKDEAVKLSLISGEGVEAATNDDGDWLLHRGIKSLLRCDEAEVVQGIARYVMSQHRSLRLGAKLMERTKGTPLPSSIALLGWLNRFLEVRPGEYRDGAVWVARLSN